MKGVFFTAWLVLGFVQMLALLTALEDWMGLHWLLALPCALFLGYLPLVGAVLSFFAVMKVWGWPWFGALALCFPGFLVMLPVFAGSLLAGRR